MIRYGGVAYACSGVATEATQLLDEISRLLDTRLFKWRQVAWSLERTEPVLKEDSAYGNYRATVYDWNFALNRNRSLLCRYFGAHVGAEFESIMYSLNDLHDSVVARRRLS